jgi:hypothetical protein
MRCRFDKAPKKLFGILPRRLAVTNQNATATTKKLGAGGERFTEKFPR